MAFTPVYKSRARNDFLGEMNHMKNPQDEKPFYQRSLPISNRSVS